MLALGVVASDLSLLFCETFVELAWCVPFGAFIALVRRDGGGTPRAGARSSDRKHWSQAGGAPQLAQEALYAAQLRRAAPVVHLFAVAPSGGEREAAYHALIRLAAAANASLGMSPRGGAPLITPGALYRDLTQGTRRWPTPDGDAQAFDAQVCAELDRRDAARPW
jgi:hypothetical protein